MHFTMWWSILGICNEFIIASHPELIALSLISNSSSSFIPPHPSWIVSEYFPKPPKTNEYSSLSSGFSSLYEFYTEYLLHFRYSGLSVYSMDFILFYFILFIWFVFCKIYLYMIYLLHFDVYIFFFIHIYMVRIIQSHASERSVLLSFPKSIIKMRRIG